MSGLTNAIRSARKIVVKIGSNTLAQSDGAPNSEFMDNFAAQCRELANSGNQIVLVSCNASQLGKKTRCALQTGTLCNRAG